MLRLLLLCVFVAVSVGNEWVLSPPFRPAREYYVAPGVSAGTGSGTMEEPFSFESAASTQRGESVLFWLLPGNYTTKDTRQDSGIFVIECSGQFKRPCVFRCTEDYACWLQGVVEIKASESWIWGMKISDVEGVSLNPCPVSIGSAPPQYYVRVNVINNLIISTPGTTQNYGLCFSNDIATVVYGNIVYGKAPNLNISNSYGTGNYKYVVGNLFLNPLNGTNLHAVVDADTDGMGEVSGLYVAKNIFSSGNILLGAKHRPDFQNVFLSNQFIDSEIQIGQSQPAQCQIVNNFFVRSRLRWLTMWGIGEEQFPERQIFISSFTKNSFYGETEGDLIRFGTGIYVEDTLQKDTVYFVRSSDIRNDTTWDGNSYSHFSASYHAHKVFETHLHDRKWKALTKLGGIPFDATSMFNATYPRFEYKILPNEYDYKKVFISFYAHYPQATTVSNTFDICCFLAGVNWTLSEHSEVGLKTPSFNSETVTCDGIKIDFEPGTPARFFLLQASEDLVLDACPEGSWVADIELKFKLVSSVVQSSISSQTVAGAISGGIVFVICLAASVLYYRKKHKHDIEWKAMKEAREQEMDSESL
eukprot:TRINITY_DN4785_c0_g1_i1.p1 TRINITY_DN4785_c0_g1~~TRINITY_DN4785_c0_g1_i1.p1  ORF type:complete len:601 (-),score=117.82 TRINITY_DN4785_c0_g1_i1:13-1773(-)